MVPSGAGRPRTAAGGVSKAMPPIRSDSSEAVRTFIPSAATDTSIPLAFQNWVFSKTSAWCGAAMKIVKLTSLASSMFLLTTELVLALLVSHYFLREAASGRVLMAVALAFGGAVAIGAQHLDHAGSKLEGDLLALMKFCSPFAVEKGTDRIAALKEAVAVTPDGVRRIG